MQSDAKVTLVAIAAALISPAVMAESDLIIGGEIMEMEVKLGYAQGNDVFTYEGTRFRIGMESDAGFGVGLEYTPAVEDEAANVVGTPFRLEVGDTLGVYMTAGSWVYFRLGWSSWETTYTRLDTGVSNGARSNALDYGVGFRTPIAPGLTLFGEYVQRNTNVNYNSFFVKVGTDHADLSYDSELYTLGVYFTF